MVQAVRSGESLRGVARAFGVSMGTVAAWVERASGQRIDRVVFTDRKPGRAWNRTPPEVEQFIPIARSRLRESSVLGEYGPDAIGLALSEEPAIAQVPSAGDHSPGAGALGCARWHASAAAAGAPQRVVSAPSRPRAGRARQFRLHRGLEDRRGPLLSVLTGTSLHGALPDAWILERPSAKATLEALTERWQVQGLPTYAQFDNETIFQGAHQFADAIGRVSRLCLALKVIPVFAPPREPGFQNAIEGFNALWQSKVWQRHHCPDVASLVALSQRYIAAYRAKTAPKRESAPHRHVFPKRFALDLNVPLQGTMIFVRRSDDKGNVHLLGRPARWTDVGRIDSCAARWTLPITASDSSPYGDVTRIRTPSFASRLTTVPINLSKANHECSVTLRLCHVDVKKALGNAETYPATSRIVTRPPRHTFPPTRGALPAREAHRRSALYCEVAHQSTIR